MELLIHSLDSLAAHSGEVAEIGSWRGVTTTAMALNTYKTVYAIDPHPVGAFEGVEEAHKAFQHRIAPVPNIRYIRKCSGEAFMQCSDLVLSMVFVDAMHDFVSANFDLNIWLSLISTGGLLALHDVDDHPGVNLALQRALRRKDLIPWGYCPNLIVLKKA
jgi:predicted O-methyltransferase YrrM